MISALTETPIRSSASGTGKMMRKFDRSNLGALPDRRSTSGMPKLFI
jgi:hypothetical protein